jgi:hypothetical protein
MPLGSNAGLIRFMAAIASRLKAMVRNTDYMMPMTCSPEMVPPNSTAI